MELSVNKKNNAAIKLAASYILPVLCGAAVIGALTALFAGVMYALGMPPGAAGFLSFTALAAGTLAGGFLCGLIKRCRGLRSGAVCAALFLAPMLLISVVSGSFSGGEFMSKAVTIMLASCTGAVLGVNARPR